MRAHSQFFSSPEIIYNVSESVKATHGLQTVYTEELYRHLQENNIQLIDKENLELIGMGSAGKGVKTKRPILAGQALLYGVGGVFLNLGDVNNLSTEERKLMNHKGIATNYPDLKPNYLVLQYTGEENPEMVIKTALISSELPAHPAPFIAIMYNLKNCEYEEYLFFYEPTHKLITGFSQLDLKTQHPNLFSICQENAGDLEAIKYAIHNAYNHDPVDLLTLLPPKEMHDQNDFSQYMQHAGEAGENYYPIHSHNKPNFTLTLTRFKGHAIPVLIANQFIESNTLLSWNYINKMHLQANNIHLKVWTPHGKDINLPIILHKHYLIGFDVIISLINELQQNLSPHVQQKLLFSLFFCHRDLLLALTKEEIDFLLTQSPAFSAIEKPFIEVARDNFRERCTHRLNCLKEDGYILEVTDQLIESTCKSILSSPYTASFYLCNQATELKSLNADCRLNRDQYYVPRRNSHLKDINKKDISNAYWKQSLKLGNEGVALYKNKNLDKAIEKWQHALALAKNAITTNPVRDEREIISLTSHPLYWDKKGHIACLYKNLATVYGRINMRTEQFYCLEKCSEYIKMGYQDFYKDSTILAQYDSLAQDFFLETSAAIDGVPRQ